MRRAQGGDARAVAQVHVESWQQAYRGMVSDQLLDGLSVTTRAESYSFDRDGPGDPSTWLAEDEVGVAGFVTIGALRDDETGNKGEVMALYVAPRRWRTGVGSALLARGEALLAARGFDEGLLWVLRANESARRFYEAAGWSLEGGANEFCLGDESLVEVRYRKALAFEGSGR